MKYLSLAVVVIIAARPIGRSSHKFTRKTLEMLWDDYWRLAHFTPVHTRRASGSVAPRRAFHIIDDVDAFDEFI